MTKELETRVIGPYNRDQSSSERPAPSGHLGTELSERQGRTPEAGQWSDPREKEEVWFRVATGRVYLGLPIIAYTTRGYVYQ